MIKQALRILIFPAVCVIWLFGWLFYSTGYRQAKAKRKTNHSSLNSINASLTKTVFSNQNK